MKTKIEQALPAHTLRLSNAPKIYIVDYKNSSGGAVALLEQEPTEIKSVYLENKKPIGVYFDGFKDNALPIAKGEHSKQCECVLFPQTCNDKDWILFIETKYTNDLRSAFDENHDYPNGMINQIIQTVQYFRAKQIIAPNRRVHAIVSFPNLIEAFNSTFFKGELSIEDILIKHKILVRATNSAIIKSEKRISLNAI